MSKNTAVTRFIVDDMFIFSTTIQYNGFYVATFLNNGVHNTRRESFKRSENMKRKNTDTMTLITLLIEIFMMLYVLTIVSYRR